MLFVSVAYKGKVWITDTDDWVMECIDKKEFNSLRKKGVVIRGADTVYSMVRFISSMCSIYSEVGGGSTFEFAVSSVLNGDISYIAGEVSGSTLDLIESTITQYKKLQASGFSMKESDFYDNSDSIFWCIQKIEYAKFTYRDDARIEDLKVQCEKKFHISRRILKECLLY